MLGDGGFLHYRLGIQGAQMARDLWRQKDLGQFEMAFSAQVAPHGVVLIKLSPVK